MNSSAKSTAAISFLAAAALGAVVFMGCKVGSDTDDDTDGDENTPTKDAGNDNDNEDASDSGNAPTCESGQGTFDGPLQECLNANCCDKLTTCFSLTGDADAGLESTCGDYATCIEQCSTQEDADACYDICDSTTTPEIITAYEAIVTCANANSCGQ